MPWTIVAILDIDKYCFCICTRIDYIKYQYVIKETTHNYNFKILQNYIHHVCLSIRFKNRYVNIKITTLVETTLFLCAVIFTQ